MSERKATRASGGYGLLLKDSAIYGAGRMLQKFLSALLLPLYTYFLSPADYGVLGMVLVTTALIDVVVTLGFDVAFSRFYFDDKTEEGRNRVITNVFWIDTVYPAVVLGLLAVFMPQISNVLMKGPGYALYFQLALLNEFFTNWSDLPFTLFRLEHKPWKFSAFMFARIAIQIPLTVLLVVSFHMGVMGVLIGNAVTSFTLNAASLPTYWRRLAFKVDVDLMKKMLAFAIPAVFTALVFFILKLSDRYFLMRYWGKTQVGLYTTAFTLSEPVYMAMTAFRMAWPQWHYAKLDDPQRHKRMVSRSSTYFMLLCVAMMTVTGVFMPLLIRLLTSRQSFWSVGPTTLVLTFSTVLYSLYFVFWVGANVAKKNRQIPLITAVASALNVGLNLAFIPRYGMIAAAWSTVAGFAVLAALMYRISQRHYRIAFEWARLVKMGVASGLTILAAWTVAQATGESVRAPFGDVMLHELYKAPVALLFPLLLYALGFLTPGERERLARAARRLRRRPAMPAAAAAGAATLGDAATFDNPPRPGARRREDAAAEAGGAETERLAAEAGGAETERLAAEIEEDEFEDAAARDHDGETV